MYDLPKKFNQKPKKFQNGIGELFMVTEYKPELRTKHEKAISSILTADGVDIYRPLREIWGMVHVVHNQPICSKTKMRKALISYLSVPYVARDTVKLQGLDKFVAYVKEHINNVKSINHGEEKTR